MYSNLLAEKIIGRYDANEQIMRAFQTDILLKSLFEQLAYYYSLLTPTVTYRYDEKERTYWAETTLDFGDYKHIIAEIQKQIEARKNQIRKGYDNF